MSSNVTAIVRKCIDRRQTAAILSAHRPGSRLVEVLTRVAFVAITPG
ncbi:hypothetical protein [Microbacterium sp.]|nr:hypothetical protein [Microbacterium sp.]